MRNIYFRDQWKAELDVYESVIEEDENTRPRVIVCVPLFYPGHSERALAILSFEFTVSNSSLFPYLGQPNAAATIQSEFQDWYTSTLARAIGLPSTHKYWHGAASLKTAL
jgi:hypothetical protein